MWHLVTKSGSWLTIAPQLASELADKDIPELPEKVQGLNQLYDLLESRKDVSDYLYAKFKAMVGGGAT